MNTGNKLQTVATNAIAKLTLDKISDVPSLTVVYNASATLAEKAPLARAKSLEKIRDIFAREKEDVKARKASTPKGHPIPTVNIMGYKNFVEYAEKELGLSKASANNIASVGKLIAPNGVESIFDKMHLVDEDGNVTPETVDKNGGFGYTHLISIASTYADEELRPALLLAIQTGKITPSMTIQELKSERYKIKHGEKELVEDVTEDVVEDVTEDVTEEATPVDSGVKITLSPAEWQRVIEAIKVAIDEVATDECDIPEIATEWANCVTAIEKQL